MSKILRKQESVGVPYIQHTYRAGQEDNGILPVAGLDATSKFQSAVDLLIVDFIFC